MSAYSQPASQQPAPLPFSSEPLTLRVGVIGGDASLNPDPVRRGIRELLTYLDVRLAGTPHRYLILSPPGNRAGCLVAECVAERAGESQHVESITALNAGSLCDLLVAVWEGKTGSTGAIARSAQAHNVAVFRIHPRTGKLRQSRNGRDLISQLDALHQYNHSEISGSESISSMAAEDLAKLQRQAGEFELEPPTLLPLRETVLPQMVKASQLASRYQGRYLGSETWGYIFSASAVATAALLTIFFQEAHKWWLLEGLEIAAVIVLTWPSAQKTRLRKWIEYRYLAERLRAACFLYVAGLKEEIAAPPIDLQLSWLPHNWVMAAIRETCMHLPSEQQHLILQDPVASARVRQFIRRAWIDHQRIYYEDKAERNRRKNEVTELLLRVLLIVTVIAPIVHAFYPDEHVAHVLAFFAITLPACAGAAAGISVFQHYNRNAERYESMSRHLREIGDRLASDDVSPPVRPVAAQATLTPLQKLVREADRAMLHEHQGWRTVFGVRLPGPG